MGRLLASNARGDLANALRRDVNIITFAHACKGIKWQGDSKKLAAGTKEFLEQVTTRMNPVVLLGMRKGSPFLQLVHSVSRFLGCPMEEDEYNGTYIGFLGDRKGTLNPTTITLEEKLVGG